MALPRDIEFQIQELEAVSTEFTAIQSAIDALPPTPVEADLPDIVAIIADLRTTANTLNSTVTAFIALVKKVRIAQ